MAAKKKRKRKKVQRIRRRVNINLGMVIFGAIFLYIAIYTVMYFTRDRVSIYEVVYGKNADVTNKTYQALLLRSEQTVQADVSGYMNYYVRSGERASVGTTVYTIDESGKIQEYLASNEGGVVLTDKDYETLRKDISQFTMGYSDLDFSETYNFKIDLSSTLLECTNMNMINEKLAELSADQNYNYSVNRAATAGIIEYYSDGYEGKAYTDITQADFTQEQYQKKAFSSGSLIAAGDVAYKIISEENWQVLLPLSEEEAQARQEDTRIRIKFLDDGTEVSGDFQIVRQNDCVFGLVSLNQYMLRYAGKRYAQIQIVEEQMEGLKIPKSSVAKKEFFTIPKEFSAQGGDSNETGFYRRQTAEDGSVTVKFLAPEIYYADETHYYVDEEEFKKGDVLIKNDSADTFTVGETVSLEGVFNVNSGYCIFRRIEILSETGDYYLVSTGTSYGLKVYDHIVLEGNMVKENAVVFR